jgi:excinuclease ABC subunit C
LSDNLIKEQFKRLPTSPGVYLMKDAAGNVLYVGKAANLRNRVRSYFGSRQKLSLKLERMVSRIGDIDFFVTASEQEALVLELNLIKRHRPHYNVRLKDDKNFPYLKIDMSEDWPRVQITRRLAEDGNRYFGPFASVRSVRQALKVVTEIFPFRSCSITITGTLPRPCLEYDIHRCAAPCINGAISKEEYAEIIRQVILFLEGKQELVVRQLKNKMRRAALTLEYEKAAGLRDQLHAVERVLQYQRMATAVSGEQDLIAFTRDSDHAYVQVFFIRGGKLIGRESFTLQGTRSEEPEQIMTSFVKQFYDSSHYIPPLILLQHPVEDRAVILSWLKAKRDSRVQIQVPRRGNKKNLVDMVAKNAQASLEQLKVKQLPDPVAVKASLEELKRELNLPRLPFRMEGYDISNIQGRAAVGSMVVFSEGRPNPAHYRRFKIKTVPAADDYAMLREIIRRRFGRQKTSDALNSWAILPDLILVDGGKGQLSSVLEAMHAVGADTVPVASLAKENEEIFIPKRTKPIRLPLRSSGLQLLQRIRDEAHRFALGYHQRIRKKQIFASTLDAIPGIGPKRKRHLLRQFGSVQAIREASLEELAAAKGMSQKLAQKIKGSL